MITDLQKASLWKRISAALFDFILLAMLAVGVATLLSSAFGYNGHIDKLNGLYEKYESQYGVEFQITQAKYEAMSEQQRQNYDTAYQALVKDPDVTYTYNVVLNLTLLTITFGVFLSVIALELVVPLLLKNGQTLGKKIFGIALMHTDGIRVSNLQMFVRTVLGKFTFEMMIPIYILLMILFNAIGMLGAVVLIALLTAEIICMAVTRTNSLLHDVLSGTVAVDMASQMIFKTRQELLEYVKKIHAQEAERADYK